MWKMSISSSRACGTRMLVALPHEQQGTATRFFSGVLVEDRAAPTFLFPPAFFLLRAGFFFVFARPDEGTGPSVPELLVTASPGPIEWCKAARLGAAHSSTARRVGSPDSAVMPRAAIRRSSEQVEEP